MTEPQHIMTNPQHLMTNPQHIITEPQHIITEPQRLQEIAGFSTKLRKAPAEIGRVVTPACQ